MTQEGERLQKVMAHAGVASRRVCENLITAGRVKVDGTIVRTLGTRVGPDAVIHVDDRRIFTDNDDHLTIAFHKPEGVVCTMEDPEGRPSLADYTAQYDTRLFHVGRLDIGTEGLLLLTNDGELAHRLTHPSYEVRKTYVATVRGKIHRGIPKRMREGIELDDGVARADRFTILEATDDLSLIQITLHIGRNRVVRRMLDAVGFPVVRLVRTQVGPITLGDMRAGKSRPLNSKEVAELMHQVGL